MGGSAAAEYTAQADPSHNEAVMLVEEVTWYGGDFSHILFCFAPFQEHTELTEGQ